MSNERLELTAEVKDNMSQALRKIQKELAAIGVTPGMTSANKWATEFKKNGDDFVKAGTNAAGVMSAMGIGGLAAGASIGALVTHFKNLGENKLAMKELSRETGVTLDYLNAFSHAGRHFGVSAEAMQGAIKHLNDQMPEFRNGLGSLHDLMAGYWPNLTKKLETEGTADQIKDIVAQLDKLQNNPALQKRWLNEMFGSGDEMEKLFANGAKGFREELDRQLKQLRPISPEMLKNAQEFRDATIKFNDALENFENKVGPAFLKGMTAIVDQAERFFNLDPEARNKAQYEGGKASEAERHKGLKEDLENGSVSKWLKQAPTKSNAHPMSYGGGDLKSGLFQRASFSGGSQSPAAALGLEEVISGGTKKGVLAAFREMLSLRDLDKSAATIRASFDGTGAFGGGGPSSAHFGSGAALGFPRRNRGGGHGPVDFQGLKDLASGPMRDFLNFVGKTEGTDKGRGYNETLGYGAYTGGPVDLTKMTLDQVDALQGKMLHNPKNHFNSSAAGRYQIVRKTLRGLRRALGLKGSELFDEKMQDILATKLAKDRGANAAGLAQEWASLKRHSAAEILGHYNNRGGSARSPASGLPHDPDSDYRNHRGGKVPIPPMTDLPGDPPRRANGLNGVRSDTKSPEFRGSADVHVHIHGQHDRATARSSGMINTSIHRWPVSDVSEQI